jgi:hypothetical protein
LAANLAWSENQFSSIFLMVSALFSAAVKHVQANNHTGKVALAYPYSPKNFIYNFYSSRQKKNLMKQVKQTAEAFLAEANSRDCKNTNRNSF